MARRPFLSPELQREILFDDRALTPSLATARRGFLKQEQVESFVAQWSWAPKWWQDAMRLAAHGGLDSGQLYIQFGPYLNMAPAPGWETLGEWANRVQRESQGGVEIFGTPLSDIMEKVTTLFIGAAVAIGAGAAIGAAAGGAGAGAAAGESAAAAAAAGEGAAAATAAEGAALAAGEAAAAEIAAAELASGELFGLSTVAESAAAGGAGEATAAAGGAAAGTGAAGTGAAAVAEEATMAELLGLSTPGDVLAVESAAEGVALSAADEAALAVAWEGAVAESAAQNAALGATAGSVTTTAALTRALDVGAAELVRQGRRLLDRALTPSSSAPAASPGGSTQPQAAVAGDGLGILLAGGVLLAAVVMR